MKQVLYKLKRNTSGVWWSFTLRRAYAYKRLDIDIVEAWLVDIQRQSDICRRSSTIKLMGDDLIIYVITPKRLLYRLGASNVGDF